MSAFACGASPPPRTGAELERNKSEALWTKTALVTCPVASMTDTKLQPLAE